MNEEEKCREKQDQEQEPTTANSNTNLSPLFVLLRTVASILKCFINLKKLIHQKQRTMIARRKSEWKAKRKRMYKCAKKATNS